MNKERLVTLLLIVFAAAFSRLLPHPDNVAPIAAIALFAGAQFERKSLAFILPLAALLLSDIILGFYPGMLVNYLGFAAVVCIGFALRGHQKPLPIACATLAGSVAFFLISNTGVWLSSSMYEHTLSGLAQCWAAGIPFFRHTLAGDAFYSVLFFGGFALAEQKFSGLRSATA